MERGYLDDDDLLASPFFDKLPIDDDRDDDCSGRKDTLTRHISRVISYFTNCKIAFGRQSMLLNQMIFYLLPSGTLIWASPKVLSTLKYSKSEVLQKRLVDFIHSADKMNFLDYLSKNIASQFSNDSVIFRLLTKENDVILMELRSKFSDRGGKSVIVSYGREYTLDVAAALDRVLDYRFENLQLRIELAKTLLQKGLDPKQHPLLQDSAFDPGLSLQFVANNSVDLKTEKSNGLYCRQCGVTESPEWRKGPEGKKT